MPVQLGSAYGKVIIDASGVRKGTDEGVKGIQGMEKAFGMASRKIASGAALITGEVLLLKKVFDFGKEGAAVIQAGESWDVLLDKIGAAPDLLDQLRRASHGTVDDLKLMNSTSLLLAGTQGELATQLANATPHLLEIAKAAQKLNPSLGDTTFLYDSLARGIKRASPLILDNLGLVIRLEESYSTYAKSIGVSTDELTAEQQKIALLNEVMRAGNVLIEQAGGNVDSATDSFSRMETSVIHAGDAIKAKLAPALADAADGVYYLLTYTNQLDAAYDDHSTQVLKAAKSYEEYAAEVVRSAVLTGRINEWQAGQLYKVIFAHDDLSDVSEKERRIIEELLVATGLLTRADFDLARAVEGATKAEAGHKTRLSESRRAMLLAAQAADTLGMSLDDLQMAMAGAVGQEMKDFHDGQRDLAVQAQELREKIGDLAGADYLSSDQKEQIGDLQKELGGVWARIRETEKELKEGELNRKEKLGATQRLEDLRDRAGELERAIRKMGGRPYLTEAQKKELNELQDEYDETKKKISENAAEHELATKRILFDILQQKTAQAVLEGKLTESEANQILEATAIQWGLIDEATKTAMSAVDEFLKTVLADGKITRQEIIDLDKLMRGLPTSHTFTLTIRQRYQQFGAEPGPEAPVIIPNPDELDPGLIPGGANGLHGFISPGHPNDTGLLMAHVTSGEQVDIWPNGQRGGGGDVFREGDRNNTVNIFQNRKSAAIVLARQASGRQQRLDRSM